MRTNQFKKMLLTTGFISVIAIAACTSGDNKKGFSKTGEQKEEKATTSTPLTFKDEKVSRVYSNYVILKDALVNSNEKEAGMAAGALQVSLNETSQTKAADLAGKIASASSLKSKREPFNALSMEIETVLKGAEITGGTIYKQYCPMANENEGGYWFASESSIRNPYYGDEMMTCGSVKEEIR